MTARSFPELRRARHGGAARACFDNIIDTFLEFADGSATGTPQSTPKAFESTAELLGYSPAEVATIVRLAEASELS